MNLIAMNAPLTMSSTEIATLVESRPDSVKRTIERLADRGVIQLPPMVEVKNHKGQPVQEYLVGKRDSYVVVAQLCPEFTARLVDRWQELEAKQAPALPTSYKQALIALVAEVEAREQVEHQLALAAPKLAVHDLLLDTKNTRALTDVGKALGFRSGQQFCKQLHADGYLFKRAGVWEAYAHHIESGLFELKIVVLANGTNQKQTRVTPKGMDALALRYQSTQEVAA